MKLDAAPPIDAAVRHALLVVLEEARVVRTSGSQGYDDAWRRAALREAVEDDDPSGAYALSPRSTRGATRA